MCYTRKQCFYELHYLVVRCIVIVACVHFIRYSLLKLSVHESLRFNLQVLGSPSELYTPVALWYGKST